MQFKLDIFYLMAIFSEIGSIFVWYSIVHVVWENFKAKIYLIWTWIWLVAMFHDDLNPRWSPVIFNYQISSSNDDVSLWFHPTSTFDVQTFHIGHTISEKFFFWIKVVWCAQYRMSHRSYCWDGDTHVSIPAIGMYLRSNSND